MSTGCAWLRTKPGIFACYRSGWLSWVQGTEISRRTMAYGKWPDAPLIHALRGVMLEGTSLVWLGADLAVIAAWGCVSFVLALRWFRWT